MTREIAAEASLWIARLHGPARSKHLERECLAWQARSPAHRLAFERCTDLWMDIAGVDRAAVARTVAAEAEASQLGRGLRPGRRTLGAATAAMLVLVAALVVLQPSHDVNTYDTGLGEQRLVVLRDGTRLSLNTSTRVRVELGPVQRRVSIESGEAFFEVAKEASRPFVVRAAGTEVTATGTAFVVRLTPASAQAGEALDVTLVEGQVVVREADRRTAVSAGSPSVVMAPGERLRVRGDPSTAGRSDAQRTPLERDRPRMDQVLAWKRGEAVFDNTSLLEALGEMNRYSATPIVADAGLAQLRVSGLYKTGDNVGFAHAIAALHGLLIREHADRLELQPR